MDLQINKWLSDLGLDRYADAFHENDVDGRILHLITNDDLKELGVSLGHRKLMLSAIRDLQDHDNIGATATNPSENDAPQPDLKSPAPTEAPASNTLSHPLPSAVPLAERRHLTVLFADLVGSTELTNRLDPEDMRLLLQRYQDAVAGAVSRYGGYVAKYLGDGLLVFFGWPSAYEDHAIRAVKAGLNAIERVNTQKTPDGEALSMRVGVASGEVVVGDTIGENTYEEGAMTGPTVNLAARIQEHAPVNTVVLPEEGSEKSLMQIFEFTSLGRIPLKGFDTSFALMKVDAERSAQSRFRAAHTEEMASALVGRDLEHGILQDAWRHVQGGKGEVVLLAGEAGIGKSRLTEEFLSDSIVAQNADIIRLNCSPYLTSSPFHPVTERISQDAGIEPNFDDERAVQHVKAMLVQRPGLDVTQVLPVFAALVAPATEIAQDVLSMSPQDQRDLTIQTLIHAVKIRSTEQPVILFVEDAHWIDPSTNALIDRFKDVCADLPLMILITHRPEWKMEQAEGDAHIRTLHLRRFDAERVADLVQNVSGQEPDGKLVKLIMEKTDGVPLFVEELTRAITVSGRDNIVNVPSSLKGMLMARLDAVSQGAKQVALAGSVIGREIDPVLLHEVVQDHHVDTQSCLEELRKSGLIFESGHGRGNYVFRHALIRDTAYQSMLLSTRRSQHARVAQALLKHRAAEIERQPELVARHLTEAEDWKAAFPRWLLATEKALARSASHEAIANAKETLQAAGKLGDTKSAEFITAEILVGRSYDSAGHLPECITVLERAWHAARDIGHAELAAEAANHFADTAMMSGDRHAKAIAFCTAALEAIPEQDEERRCELTSQLARAYMFMGQFEQSNRYSHEALALAAKLGNYKSQFSVMMSRFGAPYVARDEEDKRNWRANLEAMHSVAEKLGNIDQGRDRTLSMFVGAEMADRQLMDHSLELLTEIATEDNHLQLYWVLVNARAMQSILDGDFKRAEEYANEAVKIGRQTHGEHVEGVYGVQMFTIRREQKRLHEVAPVIKRLMTDNPEDISWKPGFGLIAAELGYKDAAERVLEELAETGFELPRDAMYSTTLSYLADICVAVQSLEHSKSIYELLLPYRELTITAGATTVCTGAGARRLGNLAALMGDWAISEQMFETAIKIDTRMASQPWLAYSKADCAAALRRRGRKSDLHQVIQLEAEALATAQNLDMVALASRLEGQAV